MILNNGTFDLSSAKEKKMTAFYVIILNILLWIVLYFSAGAFFTYLPYKN